MKNLKNITISVLTAGITFFGFYTGYNLYAADGDDAYGEYLKFDEVMELYHEDMNEYFNDKFERVKELVDDDGKFSANKQFERPADITSSDDLETTLEKCNLINEDEEDLEDDNLSSYCVSMGALDKYMDYVEVLDSYKGLLETPPGALENNITTIIAYTKQRNKKIDEQYEKAKQTMEAAVATYHEFRLAYPMHKKYRELAKKLIKYKLGLKDIRKRLAFWPGKFHDATSSQCE